MNLKCNFAFFFAALVLLAGPSLNAQENSSATQQHKQPQASASIDNLLPPVLDHEVQAIYPAEALQKGQTATVNMLITIDEKGQVIDAEVPVPVGQGFDQAALNAVRQFRFKPALLKGQPVAVKIAYSYHFVVDQQDKDPNLKKQASLHTVNGLVLQKGTRKPLIAAQIFVQELELSAETNERGEFSLKLPIGRYHFIVAAEQHRKATTQLTVSGRYLTNIEIYLPSEQDERYTTVVRDRMDDRAEEPVIRLSRQELRHVPGTFGDPVRVLQTLPGVARPRSVEGDIVVRGSEPGNTPLYLGGYPVPFLYHFGILHSVVDPAFVDGIDFYPGSVPLRYGNAAQGVVNVRSGEGKTKGFHAEAQVGDLDLSGAASLPLFDNKLRLDLGGRRSYLGASLPLLMSASSFIASEGQMSVNVVPKYWDYNLRLSGGDKRFRPYVNLFGAHDSVVINIILVQDYIDRMLGLRDANEDDLPDKLTLFDQTFHHLVAGFNSQLEGGLQVSASMLLGQRSSLNLLDTQAYFDSGMIMRRDTKLVSGRVDLRIPVARWLALRIGADGDWRDEYIHPSDEIKVLADLFPESREYPYSFGAYVAGEGKPWPGGRITLGSRLQLDRQHDQDFQRMDPRFVVEQDAGLGVSARFSVARQSQLPDFKKTSPALGGAELPLTTSDQVMGGLRAKMPWDLEFGLDAYVSRMRGLALLEPGWDVFINEEGDPGIIPTMRYIPADGKAYGLEFSLRRRPKGRFYGWISFSMSRSLRDTLAVGDFVGDYDQPFHLIAVAAYKLGWGVELSGRFRLASGNPYTPFVGAFDVDTGEYQELRGRHNSARDPVYHQLDLRVDKTFTFDRFKAGLYLDVMNAYMAPNPLPISQMHLYSYDHFSVSPIGFLPLIPMLGFSLEY